MPSLSTSPWILGAPQSGLARLMSRINFLVSADSFGRPPSDFDFHRQYERKPARCQRITVSGLMIAKALNTFGAKRYSPANISRSMRQKVGRLGDFRRRTFNWWRSIRISTSSEARDRKNPISPHQISLQNSSIGQKIHPIRSLRPIVLGLRQGQVFCYVFHGRTTRAVSVSFIPILNHVTVL